MSFLKKLEKNIRVHHNSTVWIRPDQIQMIVQRNCPGDTSVAQQLLDDWREDVPHQVQFAWHTKYTGWFYVFVITPSCSCMITKSYVANYKY